MRQHIPNSITLLNLFLGCSAVASIFYGQYILAFWLLVSAIAADYADGLVARLLGVSSEMGKELDSLADMVSFGVVPGAIYYSLLTVALGVDQSEGLQYVGLIGFLVTLFSCLRLAKFNLDTRQSEGFIGLPTPSSTIFTLGIMLIYELNTFGWGQYVIQPAFLLACILALSYLLIAEIPMFSLKFKSFAWKGNEIRFIFAGIAVLLLVLAREAAFSIVILLYVLFSIFSHLLNRNSKT
jgi:CDP-diacylglycerol--serine O-phosphatidyltransferase